MPKPNKTQPDANQSRAAICLLAGGFSVKDTAKLLRVSTTTVYNWRKQADTNGSQPLPTTNHLQKPAPSQTPTADAVNTEATGTAMLWQLINHQLERLTEQTADTETNLRKTDIDILYRLYSLAKERQQGWGRVVNVLRRFMLFAEENKPKLALAMLPLAEAFLAHERAQYQTDPQHTA